VLCHAVSCCVVLQLCPHWDDIASAQSLSLLREAIGGGYSAGIGEDLLLCPLPELVVVEKMDSPLPPPPPPADQTPPQPWSLTADPGLLAFYSLDYSVDFVCLSCVLYMYIH
jgi:hypothetical protein